MPDFTNFDPELIASFWIYFVGIFIVGMGTGAVMSKIFFQRQKDILDQERQGYLDKIKILEEKEKLLAVKNEELRQLKMEISNNELYWSVKNDNRQKSSGDKVLFDLIHNSAEHKK